MKISPWGRLSIAAYKSGYMHVWEDLDQETQCWIIATQEVIETLEQAQDHVSKPDNQEI